MPWYLIPSNHKWFRDLAYANRGRHHERSLACGCPKPTVDLEAIRKEYHEAAEESGKRQRRASGLRCIAVALEGSVGVTEWDAKVGVTLVYSQLGLLFLFLATHDDVRQAPRIFAELNLQIAVLIDYQLCRRVQHAG